MCVRGAQTISAVAPNDESSKPPFSSLFKTCKLSVIRSYQDLDMFQMIMFFTATAAVAFILYQYQQAVLNQPRMIPLTERVAGAVTEGMIKLVPEPTIADKSADLDKAKESLVQQSQPQSVEILPSNGDGLELLKSLAQSWDQLATDPRYQKQPLSSTMGEGYAGSHCEMLDIKLASMISGIDKEGQQSSGDSEKHKSILVDSIPDGWRDLVVDTIGHWEAQPGVSPAKILAHTAARSLHARKIPGISSWTDESVCKLLYWEIIAAEKYMKWKNWLTFRREKA